MLYFTTLFGLAAVTGFGIGGPGDAALVAAAVLASQGHMSLAAVLIAAYLGWLLGRAIGYVGGRRGGRPLMERPGRLQNYRLRIVTKGDRLYEKYPRFAPLVAPAAALSLPSLWSRHSNRRWATESRVPPARASWRAALRRARDPRSPGGALGHRAARDQLLREREASVAEEAQRRRADVAVVASAGAGLDLGKSFLER